MKMSKEFLKKNFFEVVKLDQMQMRFMPGRGTINAIYIIKQMMKNMKWLEENFDPEKDPESEKAFNRVPREVIKWALRKKGVVEREIQVIKKKV